MGANWHLYYACRGAPGGTSDTSGASASSPGHAHLHGICGLQERERNMNVDTILLLVAFAAPGALFVNAWDTWACRKDRSTVLLIGMGIIISLVAYSTLGWIASMMSSEEALIDLSRLLGEDGKLSLHQMLKTDSLGFFLGLSVFSWIMGGFLSWGLHHARFQRLLIDLFGRSTYGNSWFAIMSFTRNGWAIVKMVDGSKWRGFVREAPEQLGADEFFLLEEPAFLPPPPDESDADVQDEPEPTFSRLDQKYVALRIQKVDHFLFDLPTSKKGEKETRWARIKRWVCSFCPEEKMDDDAG